MIPNILQVSQVKIIYQPKVKASQRYIVRNAKEAQHFLFATLYFIIPRLEYNTSLLKVYSCIKSLKRDVIASMSANG